MKNKWLDQINQNRERYRELCKNEPSMCIFLKDYWQDAVCKNDQWSAVLYEKGGIILGSLVFCYTVKRKGIVITQPILTQSNGIWIREFAGKNGHKKQDYEKEVFSGLIEELEKLPLVFYAQNYTVAITNWLPFYWKGFRQTTKYSFRIMDISDADRAIASFSSAKRRNINHAKRAGLTCKFDLPAKEFYDNHVMTLGKQGKKIVYTYETLEKIFHAVYSHGCGRTIYAVDAEQNIHAALLIIWDATCGFYLINTVDPDFRSSGAAAFLVAEMIRYLSEQGIRQFDFEGSMNEAIGRSYCQFGTTQLPYFYISKEYYHSEFERISDKAIGYLKKCVKKGVKLFDRSPKS